MRSIEWWYFLDGPPIRFSRSQHFWSRISHIPCVLRTKFLYNTNRKLHPVYTKIPLSMTLSDLWPGFEGNDIFGCRISENWRVLKTKLLLHKRKLYLTYGMLLFLWSLLTSKRVARVCQHYLSFSLPARHSKRGTCYGNVAGWLAGWVGVWHTPVLYQSG